MKINVLKLFENITCPDIVWFQKLGYSRSNPKKVLYMKKLSINFLNYVKSALKTGDHHTKNTKNITKIEQKRLLLFTFFVSLFIAFLAQKLIYITNVYLTFCLANFLNKIIY